MKWDAKENILAYLRDPANGYILANGTQNWIGSGAIYWAARRRVMLVPPKADPFIEDHIAPMASNVLAAGGKYLIPALMLGGFAVVSMRRAKSRRRSQRSDSKGGVGPHENQETLLALVLVALAALALPTAAFANFAIHGNYVTDTDACAGCHRAHTSVSTIGWTDNLGTRALLGTARDLGDRDVAVLLRLPRRDEPGC